jgi:CDP-paratose 2-epimerase
MVLDATVADNAWGWRPRIPLSSILEEIAAHAAAHPEWLDKVS